MSAYELAQAGVAGAEAQVKTAEINLGYTTITAPIAGITSLRVLPEGSLVGTGANETVFSRASASSIPFMCTFHSRIPKQPKFAG